MYIRYQLINTAIDYKIIELSKTWNELAFWSGNFICLAMSFVANFQTTSQIVVHTIAGFMAFVAIAVYFIFQVRYFQILLFLSILNSKLF